ncbi:MAG: YdcF family protein [Cyanothece sp. SIO1E1]|nr:YdcF family protein [Cyanothece sp. SIO1E1]
MAALICLATLWIVWLLSSKSLRRRLIHPLAVVIIVIIVFTSPVFVSLLTWGLTATLPPDSGNRVDTIVVLGRGENLRSDRLAATWQLWQAERAANIFFSGMMDARPMVRYLKDNGVPTSSLAGEECSQTTEENAMFTSAILRPQGVKDILLVTDPPHMWRSFLVFRSVGFNVIPHIVTSSSQTPTKTKLAREYLGMIAYAVTGKFQARSPAELDSPSPEVLRKISEWNCKEPRVKRAS